MAEKVTLMRLKVNLQCRKCTEKVKKVLCEFPVRGQWLDDKNNIVTIDVVCCSPKEIRDQICRKGGRAIKSIEIVEPPNQPDAGDKKKVSEKPRGGDEGEKKKVSEKPRGGSEAEKKKVSEKPRGGGEGEKKKVSEKPRGGGEAEKKKVSEKPRGGGEAEKKKVTDKRKDKDKPADELKNKPADKAVVSKQKDPGPIQLQLPAGMMVAGKIKIEAELYIIKK